MRKKSLFFALLILGWNLSAQQDRIIRNIDPRNKIVLKGNVTPQAQLQYDRGPVDPQLKISGMTLVLKRSPGQQAGLDKLLLDQQDPSSPKYHRWLTPQQYADWFGASPVDMAKITDWLTREGFTIDYVAQGRNWILFTGTAGQVRQTFDVELHAYRVKGETHYASPADPSLPAALAPLALGLLGLDDFRPRSDSHFYPRYTATNGDHYLVPGDVGVIYDVAPLWAKGIDGTGIKIAVTGQHDIDMSDVSLFRSHYGLPRNDPQKLLVPGSPAPAASCCEAQIDLEWSGAMAPNASLIFVYSSGASTSAFYAIDQDLAPIVTYSFGTCEPDTSVSSANSHRAEAQKANAEGITWLASTGDTGAAGCGPRDAPATTGLAISWPSSFPEVTGVGGSEFNEGSGNYWNPSNDSGHASAKSYIPEKVWNDSYNDSRGVALSAGSGGASMYFAKPSWQTGPGVPNGQFRNVPDVSFAASPHHDGFWAGRNGTIACCEGGTSISTPIFAGIVALLTQYQISIGALAHPGLGNINPTLYTLARTTPGIFNDITVGDNIVSCQQGTKDCPNGSLGYAAGPGYDLATGWGSADIYRLVTQWGMPASGGTNTTTTVTATPASITPTASTIVTTTVQAATGTATPTGSVSFSANSTALGTATLAGSGGTATASIKVAGNQLAAGSNTITASYGGAAGFNASSGSIIVSVTGGAPQGGVLTIVSATGNQVQLAWGAISGASSYSVYRLPTTVTNSGLLGSNPIVSMPDPAATTPIANVTGLAYIDNITDPSATYTYVIGAAGQFTNRSTVGPPPFGFNIAVPSTDDTAYSVGVLERMELDGNGDPAMAYVNIDPNNEGDDNDDTIFFVSWNRARYAWNAPVKVGMVGNGFSEGPTVPLSLARDASTGLWGIAYDTEDADANDTILLATSPDGVTWTTRSISGDPYSGWLSTPSLGLWNGSFYAVYLTDAWFDGSGTLFPENGTGFLYVTGKVTDPPAKWGIQVVPFPGDYINAYYTVSLALDSNHNPGVAFNVANDTYEGIAFWRPGTSTSTLVAHNDGYTTNDNPAISLAFFGAVPEVVTDAPWNYNSFDPDSEPADLWAMRAANAGGTSWMSAVDVPPDNVNEIDSPWMTTGSKGQTAIAIASNYDPEGPGMQCGFPKISRSADFLVFQTCAPAPVNSPSFSPDNMHPVLRYGANDKLWLAFNNNDDQNGMGIGLILWREQ